MITYFNRKAKQSGPIRRIALGVYAAIVLSGCAGPLGVLNEMVQEEFIPAILQTEGHKRRMEEEKRAKRRIDIGSYIKKQCPVINCEKGRNCTYEDRFGRKTLGAKIGEEYFYLHSSGKFLPVSKEDTQIFDNE